MTSKDTFPNFKDYQFLFDASGNLYFYIMYVNAESCSEFKNFALWENNNHKGNLYFLVKSVKVFDNFLKICSEDFSKNIEINIKKLDKEASQFLEIEYDKLSNNRLKFFLSQYLSQFRESNKYAMIIRFIDRAILLKLQNKISNELLSLIPLSDKKSFNMREEIAVIKLAQTIKKKKISLNSLIVKKGLVNILSKYAWICVGYYDEEPRTIKFYEEKIRELIADDPLVLLKRIKQNIRKDLSRKKKLVKGLNAKDKRLVEIAAYLAYLKDYRKFIIDKLIYHGEPLFLEISKRTNLPVELIKDMSPDEMFAIIDGKKINVALIKERIKGVIIIYSYGKVNFLTGKGCLNFKKKYLSMQLLKREFKGRVASPGFKTGQAKIVTSKNDFDKLKTGDVLVVTNTRPDFVQIMKKASAIISEEGGLTAHVSVVSREFGIPCVVGIPNITKILKDGDLVEVDANKGVVRILK